MYAIARQHHRPVSRISMSLPYALLKELDRMVGERGFISRSQAIADMLHQFLIEHKRERGDDIMVGTVTLVYDNSVAGLQKQRPKRPFFVAGFRREHARPEMDGGTLQRTRRRRRDRFGLDAAIR